MNNLIQKGYRNVNSNKLHDELMRAGITPILVQHDRPEGEYIAPNTWIDFPDGTDMSVVQAIIDAHDPTPIPPTPTAEERLEALELAMLDMVLGGGL